MKKIAVVTGTRAEFGLLKPLIDKIRKEERFELHIIVTGAHLSLEFGLTVNHIYNEGYGNIHKIEMLLSSDTPAGIVKSMGLGMIGLADLFQNTKFDLLVILGDRYEMLGVASAATIFKIPIAHLHGGEITEGAYDEAIRHAITKLSYLHFTSTDEYRNRVIQLGEDPERVFNVGAIGIDNIKELTLLSKVEVEQKFGFVFKEHTFLVTYHPETLSDSTAKEQFQNLLTAFDELEENVFLIFTKANADTDGRIINELIDEYVKCNPDKSKAFTSMGQLGYLSTMRYATAVVGNSSSGIIEAPSFNIPTINIGDRQKGRIQASSIINVEGNTLDILAALKEVISLEKISIINPYDNGGATNKIYETMTSCINEINVKSFYDL
jgi:GDP/UDP-N,N'-diacetylbacillosamine 2-epimerase (hydrolysing)